MINSENLPPRVIVRGDQIEVAGFTQAQNTEAITNPADVTRHKGFSNEAVNVGLGLGAAAAAIALWKCARYIQQDSRFGDPTQETRTTIDNQLK